MASTHTQTVSHRRAPMPDWSGVHEALHVRQRDVFQRISTRDIYLMTRQLATLLRAGMPLVAALSALAEQLQAGGASRFYARDALLGDILEHVRDRVNSGATLSQALGEFPQLFAPLYINMVQAGQTTGTLEQALVQLADMQEKSVKLQARLKAALMYPILMTGVAAAVVMFLLAYVVPGIARVFSEMNQTLPWPTIVLMAASHFIKTYFVLIVTGLGAAVLGCTWLLRGGPARAWWDRMQLHLPVLGRLHITVEVARLTRTLGTTLAGGIPVPRAMHIARAVLRSRVLQQAWQEVAQAVEQGADLAAAVRRSGWFPPVLGHVFATGQASGTLEQGLLEMADMYDQDIQARTKALSSLIEPLILLIMGGIVGFIVLAILLPIFEINQTL